MRSVKFGKTIISILKSVFIHLSVENNESSTRWIVSEEIRFPGQFGYIEAIDQTVKRAIVSYLLSG